MMDTEESNDKQYRKQLNTVTIVQSESENYIQCTSRVLRDVLLTRDMINPAHSYDYLSQVYPEQLHGMSYRFTSPEKRGVDIDGLMDRLKNDGYRQSKLVENRVFSGEVVEIEFAKEIAVPEGQGHVIPDYVHWLVSFYQGGE